MKNLLFVFLLFSSISSYSQLTEVTRLSFPNSRFTTDNLGNIYLYQGDELLKLDKSGKLLQRFSDKKLGEITNVDAGNPFKILVFYQPQGVIRVLDNMLAPVGGLLRLQDHGIYQPWVITSSYNNHFWVYDKTNSTLVRMSLELKESLRLDNIKLLTSNNIEPSAIDEEGNWLIIQDNSGILYLFDIFGSYRRKVEFPGMKSFQPLEETLFIFSDSTVTKYNMTTISFEEGPPQIRPGSARFGDKGIYILNKDSLYIYR